MPGGNWTSERRQQQRDNTFNFYAQPVRERPQEFHPLRVLRIAAGYTIHELAALAHVAPGAVVRAEAGATSRKTTIARLEEALNA